MENASWFKRRGIVIYIFRHRNLGWICIPLLAWQAQIGALGIAIIIIVGWMATQSVKHSSAPVGGKEGGSRHHRRETEGRGGGVISCDWGSSVKGRKRHTAERQLLPDEVP